MDGFAESADGDSEVEFPLLGSSNHSGDTGKRDIDFYTKDGSLDRHGKPAIKGKTGGWKSVRLLLASEVLAALAFTGFEVNMVLFSKSVLGQSNADAATMFSRWSGALNLFCLVGAFLSDSYIGRYLTCILFQGVMVLGLVMLSLSTQIFTLEPKGEESYHVRSPLENAIFYISIYLLALGSGAMEPALATFSADQFDEEDAQEKLSKNATYGYHYVALNFGSLIAEIVLVYLEENLGKWVLAFWISTSCGILALLFLSSGYCRYRHMKPSGNPISRFSQVIVASVRKIKLQVPSHGIEEGLYEFHGMDEKESNRKLIHTDDFKFLDKAAIISQEDMVLLSTTGNHHLCTVTQVEEVKCVLRLLPIWICTILASVVFVQVFSLFVEQGAAMNTHIWGFRLPPASMTTLDIISSSTFIVCCERIVVPIFTRVTKRKPKPPSQLQRIGIGLVVSIVSLVMAGLVEQQRVKYAHQIDKETSSLSILWQAPQYVLIGVAEALIIVAEWEFFALQIPDGLKSLGLGLSMSSSALGGYLCSIILSVVMKITTRNGKPGWVPPNLNDGHLDRFFFLSAALTALTLGLFTLAAKRYKCITMEKRDVRI